MKQREEDLRRAQVERQERLKDLEEQYDADSSAADSAGERSELMRTFASARRRYRREEEEAGDRGPGIRVTMHRIMWPVWFKIAVDHELKARALLSSMLDRGVPDGLSQELEESIVAVAAAAHTIEALYGEVKYRIPKQKKPKKRYLEVVRGIALACGIEPLEMSRLESSIKWLFDLRDFAVHPYTKPETPVEHPTGANTGVEHAMYNAVQAGKALDLAMELMRHTAEPLARQSRWVERWAEDRRPYHDQVIQLQKSRDEQPIRIKALP